MTTVYGVFQHWNRDTSMVSLCATLERAQAELAIQVDLLNKYHGPHYAPTWAAPTLPFPNPHNNLIDLAKNNYGESVWIEELPLLP